MKKILLALTTLLLFSPGAQAASAPGLLGKLSVKSERRDGYDRDLFRHWIDADRDGCDTRQEVLERQNALEGSCDSKTGQWFSVYDGLSFTTSSALDIDHMVPLAEAWDSGARLWNSPSRERFANDLYKYSLIAVSASSNRSKSDADPREWLPRASYRCKYTARWVAVKYRWRLAVDSGEKRAIRQIFSSCSKKSLDLGTIRRENPVQSKKAARI